MAVRYAIKSGNWSDPTVWDNNAVPVPGDDVYANGWTVTINTNINVNTLRNTTTPVLVPDSAVPAMSNNTTPSGYIASGNFNNGNAYLAFDQNNSTGWNGTVNGGIITIKFPTQKVIKRYAWRGSTPQASNPASWTFQGSNDGINWDPPLDTVTGSTAVTSFVSTNTTLLANTTPYQYYRLNVTSTQNTGYGLYIFAFDLTENANATFGGGVGGSFSITTGVDVVLTKPGFTATDTSLYQGATGNYLINVSAVSGQIVNISNSVGNLTGNNYYGTGVSNIWCIGVTGTATVNITGNIYNNIVGGALNYNSCYALTISGNATVNYTGNLYAGDGLLNSPSATLYLTASAATLNINGNIFGSGYSFVNSNTYCLLSTNNSTINLNNCTVNASYSTAITCSAAGSNLFCPLGTITASAFAIALTSAGTVTLNTPIINTSNVLGVLCPRIKFYPTGVSQWRFQNQASANVTIFSGTGGGMGYPEVDTVRFGSPAFGPSGEYSGTMRIPAVTNVSKGVEYGYGEIGTAVLTAEDFLDAISTSTNPMGIRLKNLSTTQTMGDQLSGFSNA